MTSLIVMMTKGFVIDYLRKPDFFTAGGMCTQNCHVLLTRITNNDQKPPNYALFPDKCPGAHGGMLNKVSKKKQMGMYNFLAFKSYIFMLLIFCLFDTFWRVLFYAKGSLYEWESIQLNWK